MEHLTSKETNEIVSRHLGECDACRHEYDLMNNEEKKQEQKQEVEIGILKNALVKTKRMYFLEGIMIATAVISVLVTAITNLAVEHTFSWFYLVLSSIILVTVESIILVCKQNEKIKGALLGLTIMILPYL
jgi:predicted anti-sigma-YlaC factor YlaD